MNLTDARAIAENLVEQMRPFCERVEIAGSVRREQAECRDIEIVAIPKIETATVTVGLFGETAEVTKNLLHEWAISPEKRDMWIKPGTSETHAWSPKADGKYWRALLNTEAGEIKLDLFLCGERNWGAILLIRTGSAEFSQAVVTHAKNIGRPCKDGFFHQSGVPVETLEEARVFEMLGLEYVEPALRRGERDVKQLRGSEL